MITPSLIYAGVTVLLALVDAIRIKIKWGSEDNISHNVSDALAWGGAVIVFGVYLVFTKEGVTLSLWEYVLSGMINALQFIAVRLAVYDPFLNLFRILTKTNPTMRLDYESATTSSYVDNHSHPIGFWRKRALALAAWFILCILSRLIFKS